MDRAEERADDADVQTGMTVAPGMVKLCPRSVPGPMPASAFAVSAGAVAPVLATPCDVSKQHRVADLALEHVPERDTNVPAHSVGTAVPGPLAPHHDQSLQQFRPVDHALPLPTSQARLPISLLGDPVRKPREPAADQQQIVTPAIFAPVLAPAHASALPPAHALASPAFVSPVADTPPAPLPNGTSTPAWSAGAPEPGLAAAEQITLKLPANVEPRPTDLGTYVPAERIEPRFDVRPPSPPARQPSPSGPAEPTTKAVAGKPWALYAKRAVKYAALAFAGYLGFVIVALFLFRFINPPSSALMIQQRFAGQDIIQEWTALEDISSNIVRAVVVSEDGRFCQHNGVDFEEMQAAIERSADGPARGASTISMQVVKNLFLWPSKSYLRKAIEIPLTYVMELLWPKRRIMEVYLNIAEWGPGIFGVEAASQFHFNKRAGRVTEREAARLAVALPNPFMRDAGEPGPGTMRLAAEIQSRMHASPSSQTGCVLKAG